MIDGVNGHLHCAPAHNQERYHRPILGSLSITRCLIECTNHTGAIDQASRSWNPDRHPRRAKGYLDLADVLRKPDFLGCHFISCLLPGCDAPKCAQCSSGGRFRIYSCPRDRACGPARAIQPPHQHHVDLAATCRFQQLLSPLPRRSARTDFFDLQSDRPTPAGCVFPHRARLHGDGLLVLRGHSGLKAHPKVCWGLFRGAAENPLLFCFVRNLSSGHFEVTLLPGRRLSFPATVSPEVSQCDQERHTVRTLV